MSEPKALNVKELFASDRYIIPLYQRNYAWGAEEVDQLIQDIWNSYQSAPGKSYYIGSLVVAQRSTGHYEVIDGQQRHTTLSILLAALKHEKVPGEKSLLNITETNLTFECRDLSTQTLKEMYAKNEKPKHGEVSMLNAYDTCISALKSGKDKEIDARKFCEYLLEKVVILRTKVPEETDLNHYFEIMNNRGEQLEKHEVLKARFMKSIKGDNADMERMERVKFARVWDACADMGRYVQMGFNATDRVEIFKNEWSTIPKALSDFSIASDSSVGEHNSLDALLSNVAISEEKPIRSEKEEHFSSIIDFTNFLLHVLRITRKNDGIKARVVLDDKKLLDEFSELPDATRFATALLQCRFLFDQYIIKREHNESKDGKWSLKKLNYYPKNGNAKAYHSYLNTYAKGDNEGTENHSFLLMIQSMFHVSYTTRNYKYWLNDALSYLYRNRSDPINADNLLAHFEKLSDRFFFGRFAVTDGDREEYDAILEDDDIGSYGSREALFGKFTYDNGVHTFIFNRLDYLLWKQAKAESPEFKIAGIEKFKFTFKSSVEHISPQTENEEDKNEDRVSEAVLHSFGNLALVSSSFNSSASNKSYKEKREAFKIKKKPESLKLALVYQSEIRGDEQAKTHEDEMLRVLCTKYQ